MSHSRRTFLQGLGATALGTGAFATLSSALGGFQQASAADLSGYKALVCIFLFGGMDTHDVVLPYDEASYEEYARIRQTLLADYAARAPASARTRDNLLPINPANAAQFGGREFALAPELIGIRDMFEAGNAAIVGNVGPLIRPLSRSQWQAGSVVTPVRLFSHNDQQATWMASRPEGASYGWGGRFCDVVVAAGGNVNPEFSSLSTLTNQLFSTGENTQPYQISVGGRTEIALTNSFRDTPAEQPLINHFRALGYNPANLIQQDLADIGADSIDLHTLFNEAKESLIPLATQFPQSNLGNQLRAVAETIAIRGTLLNSRQVFMVATGGFDTHSEQVTALPGLLRQIDEAVVAFYSALEEIGASNEVVTFTASDFGRTLAVNGDGTDHGWGSHHFVIGGGVEGGTIYGDIPPHTFDHDQDAGGGRLIPTTSVEEMAEPLGRWFGLNDSELRAALPNLPNFEGSQASQALRAIIARS